MSKGDREHTSAEFGQMPSTGVKGLDAPMIGAPVSITLDGIVERESGRTPTPPPVSVKAVAVALVVMLLLGLGMLAWVRSQPPPDFGEGDEYSMSPSGLSAGAPSVG